MKANLVLRSILWLGLSAPVWAQFAPLSPALRSEVLDDVPPEPRLTSNVIIDILPARGRDSLWLATGNGVTRVVRDRSDPRGFRFETYTQAATGGRGGVSGLLVDPVSDSIIWAAFAFDTSVGISGAGGGLSYSRDNGRTWTHVQQPRDRLRRERLRADGYDTLLGYWPTTTTVDNITYDIALSPSGVWIVSKGGGIRHHDFAPSYTDFDTSSGWRVVSPIRLTNGVEYPFHPGAEGTEGYIHRAFSILYADSALWVGTAAGILKSTDDGNTWQLFSARNSGISGNFITALGYQAHGGAIWAATWSTGGAEYYAVSKTTDGGATWQVHLDEAQVYRAIGRSEVVRAHAFAFDSSVVYVCDDIGLWKSPDGGTTWDLLPEARILEPNTGRRFYYQGIYCALPTDSLLWVGGVDGLGILPAGGGAWTIFQAARPLSDPARPVLTYAYPTPWSPQRWGVVKIRYLLPSAGTVKITVYDFAMSEVIALPPVSRDAGEHYEVWDGRRNGRIVANGTYFYKIEKPGGAVWGKLVVLD